jgi:DNA-binding response OmpR family regulator
MNTVLLIDDDRVTRHALSLILANGGWKVLEADDGESPWRKARLKSSYVIS